MSDEVAWYHTIDLPDGTTTPGWFDTRPSLKKIPFPESLEGKRCLDIGTADGFFAFEMEKRGAKEVVAIDVDDPMRRDWPWNAKPTKADMGGSRKPAFERAKQLLDSSVQRENIAIYDLDPSVVGTFDFAFIGSLLLHLRDPVRALAAVASVLDGELLVADAVSIYLSLTHPGRPTARFEAQDRVRWWVPNMSGLRTMIVVAGYDVISHGGPYFIPVGDGFRRLNLRGIRNHKVRRLARELVLRSRGFPHAWVLAKPRA